MKKTIFTICPTSSTCLIQNHVQLQRHVQLQVHVRPQPHVGAASHVQPLAPWPPSSTCPTSALCITPITYLTPTPCWTCTPCWVGIQYALGVIHEVEVGHVQYMEFHFEARKLGSGSVRLEKLGLWKFRLGPNPNMCEWKNLGRKIILSASTLLGGSKKTLMTFFDPMPLFWVKMQK